MAISRVPKGRQAHHKTPSPLARPCTKQKTRVTIRSRSRCCPTGPRVVAGRLGKVDDGCQVVSRCTKDKHGCEQPGLSNSLSTSGSDRKAEATDAQRGTRMVPKRLGRVVQAQGRLVVLPDVEVHVVADVCLGGLHRAGLGTKAPAARGQPAPFREPEASEESQSELTDSRLGPAVRVEALPTTPEQMGLLLAPVEGLER